MFPAAPAAYVCLPPGSHRRAMSRGATFDMASTTRPGCRRVAGIVGTSILALSGAFALPAEVAATAANHPWAWGFNKYDQLCMAAPSSNFRQTTPVQLPAPTGVVGVAAGLNHSVFVTSGGAVSQCGEEPAGSSTFDTPSAVSFGAGVSISAVAAGERFSVALATDGTVRTWGQNSVGQLGNGGTTDSTTPVQVSSLTSVAAIAAGRQHAVALKTDGTVWAWGSNSDGQLGDGSSATSSSSPVQVKTGASTNLTGVTRIGAGGYHSLAVTSGGTVKSWGANGDGQLGTGTTTSSGYAVDVSGPLLGGIDQVVGGDHHSLARRTDGTVVWAWGAGAEGQLGGGTFQSSTTPLPVVGLAGVTDLAAGPVASHSMAIGPAGIVWTWGANFYAQLGNGTAVTVDNNVRTGPNLPVPTLARGVVGAIDVAAGSTFSFAVVP